MTGPRSLWRLAAAFLLGVPAVLAGLLAALYGGLQTDAGRRTAASLVEGQLGTALETDAAVEGLAELSLDRIRMKGLRLGGPSDPWLVVENIDVVWHPLGLLAGHLSISALTVDGITVHRPPPATGGGEPLTVEDLRPPLAIAVDRFAVTTLTLDAPVLGEAATLKIDGEATAGEDGTGRLRLDVIRRDGPGGRFSARADYGLATRKLDLGLSLAEPENGVLARLLDLPGRPAVSLKLDGAGSLDHWQGRLAGGADGLMSLDTAVDLALDTRLGFALDGRADVAGLLPPGFRDLVRPEATIILKGSWDTEAARLAIDTGRFATPALEGSLSGAIDGQTLNVDGRAALRLLDASALAGLTGPLGFGTAETEITVEGPLTGPAGHVEARLVAPALPGAAATAAEVAADFEVSDAPGELMTLRGTGRLAGVTTDDARLRDLLGEDVTLEAEARIGSGGDVEILSARVCAAAAQASLSGTVTSEGAVDLAGTLEMPELARLQGLAGMPLAGHGSASVALRLDGGALRGTVAADVRDLALPAAGPAGDLLGSEVALATEIRSDAAGNWRFENIALDGRRLSASGRADLLKDFTELEADYRLRVSDLSPLSGPAGMQLGGEASLEGTAAGPLAAPAVKGRIEATLRTPWDTATLGANATLTDLDRLALRDIAAKALGTTVSGKLDIDLTKTLATGTLHATAKELAAWAPLTGTPLAGSLEADIAFSVPSGRQDLRLDLAGSALGVAATADARALTATVALTDALGSPRLDATARLDDVALPDFRLDGIDARARGPLDTLDVALAAKGPSLSVDAAGTVTATADALGLELTKLAGTAFGQDFALDGPASLRRAGDRLSVGGLRLRTGDGLIETDLDLTPEAVALNGRLSRLPLSLLALVAGDVAFAGALDGEIRLSGPPAAPNGRLALSTKQATVTVGGEAIALRVAAEGTLDAGTLAVTGTVEGPDEARLTAAARLPIRLSAAPFDFALPPDRPLSATVEGRGDLAALVGPVLGEPHALAGPLDLRMDVSGTLTAPRAAGTLHIDGGRYENIVTGTLVRDIGLEARFTGDALEIVRAGGKAGDGRFDVSGNVGLVAADGLPLDIRIHAEEAGVVRRDDLSLTVSGDLAIAGTAATPRVSGAMTVDDAELRLVDQTPPQVTTLDVVEVNAPPRKAAEPQPSNGGDVILDLTVNVPNRLFVRGKGLDSEWSGNLRITGSTAEPEIGGSLTPVRGQVSFAGKTFVLQKGSTVAFRTPGSTTPDLDLAAEYEGSDFTARFVIRGPADDPEITLTSSPELPQDEILSRILFGRGVARISAIEAAQLAQAVASLSGGGGPDFLETARRALGVDVLRIEGGEDTGPAVTAGRYLSKDVYVGVSQGTDAKSGQARVEVEVMPNVTIETEVGPTTGGEIGARWKLDY